ncbi:hypothetical protein [Methanobrevibacter arboriphilus]|uniref:hypothetical protein n=1 Tax=Methanobrevibacter arboriphilus TaxID=39441 RepID=UPI0009B578B6|nr:hypothetical protein [Methanobrevibacter arboriphilus]
MLNSNIIKKNLLIKYIQDRYNDVDHLEKFVNTANIFWDKNNSKNKMSKKVVLKCFKEFNSSI